MPAYTLVVHLVAKPDEESLKKLTAKLQEASQVYSNDKECLSWFGFSLFLSHTLSRRKPRVPELGGMSSG